MNADSHRGERGGRVSRRTFVTSVGTVFGASVGGKLLWDRAEGFQTAEVFVATAADYGLDLAAVLRSGMHELGLSASWVKRKSVLLKPNLVEPSDESNCIVTHPSVIYAAADLFLRWGAREVVVGEGSGHVRDGLMVAEMAGLRPVLRDLRIRFVDLNYDPILVRTNAWGLSGLDQLHVPKSLADADIVVSLAKLKVHHWAGVTLSMKNLFGVMPGVCYGWPKNVFHEAGITQSILDINATVKAHLGIIDGILGMEGDGPIMGTGKKAGVLVMGRNLPAVDATATRIIGGDPNTVQHLAGASGRLGPIGEERIEQRGEPISRVITRFKFPADVLETLQAQGGS